MNPVAVVVRPRSAFAQLAAAPRLTQGFVMVLASGLASLGLGVGANALARGSASGVAVALALPFLFVAYWLLEGWLVDAAAAGLLGRPRNRRIYLAVSGYAFPPWIAYALLALAEALALRYAAGSGDSLASALAWGTLPVLAWFVTLSVLAIRAVYDVPMLNALALALLPYAFVTAAILIVGTVLGALHAGGVI